MHRNRLLPFSAALLLAACASKPQQTSDDQKIWRETLAASTALVTAGCVTRNQFGDDLLLVEASARMAETLRTQSLARLAGAGMRPVKSARVLACPGHVTGESPGFVVKANRDSELTLPPQYPIALDPPMTLDPALAAAYDALYRAVVQASAPAGSDRQADARQPKALAVTARDLELIRTHLGADRLWLVNGSTGMISFAKSFATSMAIGFTTYVTLGLGAIPVLQNGSFYRADLVDLVHGQRLWHGVQGGAGIVDLSGALREAKPAQLQEWASAMYAPLIAADDKGAAPPAAAVAPAPTPALAATPPAAAAVPTKGQRWTLLRQATLRTTPRPDAPAAAELAAGKVAYLSASSPSPSGVWWYVQAEGRVGWIAAAELSP